MHFYHRTDDISMMHGKHQTASRLSCSLCTRQFHTQHALLSHTSKMHVKGASCMSGEVVQQNLESQFRRESNVLQEDVDVDKNFSVELTELSLSLCLSVLTAIFQVNLR